MKAFFDKSLRNKNHFTVFSTFSFREKFCTSVKQGKKDTPIGRFGLYATEVSRNDYKKFNENRKGVAVVNSFNDLLDVNVYGSIY